MLSYKEAEEKAERILVDGMGEALILKREEGYYALYFLFGLYGRKAPDPEEEPDFVEGPKGEADFRQPFDQVKWLEQNGYTLFINESK